jgi:hypothetical protein
MAETVEVEIKVKSNIEEVTAETKDGIKEVKQEAESVGQKFDDVGSKSSAAIKLIDKVTGGLATKVVSTGQSVVKLGKGLVSSFKAGIQGANGLKVAIASTGIGLLLVAIGTIAAYWDDIVDFVTGYNEEADRALEAATKTREAQQSSLDAISDSENLLREQGKSEEEILRMKEAQTAQVIKASKLELEALKTKKKAEEDSYKRQRDWVEGIINFITAVPNWVLGVLDDIINSLPKAVRDWLGIGRSNMKEAAERGNKVLLDSIMGTMEEATAETDALIAEQERNILRLENQASGYRLQRRQLAKKHQDDLTKILQEGIDSRLRMWEKDGEDAKEREIRRYIIEQGRLKAELKKELEATEGNLELIDAITKKYLALGAEAKDKHFDNLKDIAEEAEKEELVRTQRTEDLKLQLMQEGQDKELAALDIKYERLMAAEVNNAEALILLEKLKAKEIAAVQKKASDDELARIQALNDFKIQAALDTINVFKDFNALFDKDNEEAARKAFQREKALNLAETVISTYSAAQKAYGSQIVLGDPTSLGRAQIAAGIALAGGLARAAAIAKEKFEPKGGSANVAPRAASQSVPNAQALTPQFNIVGTSGTNQLAQSIGSQFDRPLRAYVVGGDVTTSQELERKRIKIATFG